MIVVLRCTTIGWYLFETPWPDPGCSYVSRKVVEIPATQSIRTFGDEVSGRVIHICQGRLSSVRVLMSRVGFNWSMSLVFLLYFIDLLGRIYVLTSAVKAGEVLRLSEHWSCERLSR
ncbi:hypothetical protein CPB83DRAFT_851969 [Crepidotus variabilis]|uniref:Uncharacterized protein n=1 Tax=Crepidotus variabilis TaxID=179855 RepID=A0A9P6EIU0_9AGAR|nr:hypothetical protein CPB83DRAFT_851969 [Crepidotus variabilis]